ncbi:MAG: prolyl oligopeptidase family serine peptidase [Lachnospiraceae bacterium]|nr:prolyl oligopeptidase family serine peptidase [Lachnospiraceae bacterium]
MNRKWKWSRRALALFLAMVMAFLGACGSSDSGGKDEEAVSGKDGKSAEDTLKEKLRGGSTIDTSLSFAEAHDAFTTTLSREENDDSAIPDPPEGLFDLVSYPSKVGDLAAYVSSDPGDGGKHPMIIWVVGGWGNGIDDFPWCYPEWDNDQTGSAFWQEGVLTMYPSFRGGCGNPGNYEALFGEVDDIVSAYEYAASLPYVDPDRIYLGGHSTGGTRALLASEYTDKFRAVFCFGAVDEIKYHNNTQFTFDLNNEDEFVMRSPIHWLDDIKSPTFLIEGRDGNSENLERMLETADNDKLHGYVIEGADHFSTLAPLTRVVAKKILEDTGAEAAISITQEELDAAMKQEPSVPVPVMTGRRVEKLGLTFSCPYLWEIGENEDGSGVNLYSRYEEENPWDLSALYINSYSPEETGDLQSFGEMMEAQGFTVNEISVGGYPAMDAMGSSPGDDGQVYYQRYVSIQKDGGSLDFNFITFDDYREEADPLFQSVIDSIAFDS